MKWFALSVAVGVVFGMFTEVWRAYREGHGGSRGGRAEL